MRGRSDRSQVDPGAATGRASSAQRSTVSCSKQGARRPEERLHRRMRCWETQTTVAAAAAGGEEPVICFGIYIYRKAEGGGRVIVGIVSGVYINAFGGKKKTDARRVTMMLF